MGRELAARAAAQRNGNSQGEGQVEQVRTLAQQLERMTPEFQAAMPKGREATQLVRDAMTCLRTIKNLDKCDPESFLGSLMTCAQLDLRPGVASLGHAWPLPYWDNAQKRHRAQLIVGYKGYIELGYRSGKLAGISSRVVYEGEEFDIEFHEDGDKLLHKPSYRGLRGDPVCFYSVARVVGGGYSLTDPMSVEEMQQHRDRHAPRDRNGKIVGPWVDHFLPMGKKTMILRNFALLPKSAEMLSAMQADNGIRVDLTPTADAGEVTERPPRIVASLVEHDDADGLAPGPDLGDWASRIDDIASAEDGQRAEADLGDVIASGAMAPGKAEAVRKAIEAKIGLL
jgi:recombination protein RecT